MNMSKKPYAVRLGSGKRDSSTFYVECKNGAVYKYGTPLTTEQQVRLSRQIHKNGRRIPSLTTKNSPWVLARPA